MSKDHTKTVRLGKTGKVDAVELELVSTMALEKILKTEGGKTRSEIQKLAASKKDGILARDTATGHFRIVSETDVKKAIAAETGGKPGQSAEVTAAPLTETTRLAAAELSLVSTQILRKVMKPEEKAEAAKPKTGKKDKFGGFNPYDNN